MVSQEVLALQQLLVCDVDGVMTEGSIVYATGNLELKLFNIKDGLGIRLARLSGFPVVWLARRVADAVAHRAAELNVQVYQGQSDKAAVLRKIAVDQGLSLQEVTYLGDDIDDLPAMRLAGLAIAVADAAPEVKAAAAYTTEAAGGKGAVREVIELIFRAQDRWESGMQTYLDSLTTPATYPRLPRTEE